MTTPAVPCPACGGRPTLTPGEILLYLPTPVPILRSHVRSYAFMCPACWRLAAGLADRHTLALLRTADVAPLPTLASGVTGCSAAAAPLHPEQPPAGPTRRSSRSSTANRTRAGQAADRPAGQT